MDKIYLVKPDGTRKLLASTDKSKSMSYHKLDMAINSPGKMEVDLPPNNEKLKEIDFLVDEITFERNEKEIFRGCPDGKSADFLMTGGLRVTGMLGYLENAYIPPYEYKGSVDGYLQLLLDAYNKNCGKQRPISLGTVTVTDPNDTIVRSDSGYRNVLELVQEKLVGLLGGYISVSMKDGTRTLDYLIDPPQSGQSIKYGKNLLDISQDVEYQTVYTVLIPIGATTTSEDGTVSFVDITSVNGGKYYISNDEAVEQYGWREKYMQFEDVTIPSNLLKKAETYLSTLINPVRSMTVKAVDLALCSGDEPLLPGKKVLTKSAYNNVDTSLVIGSVTMFALSPEDEVIEIGASVSTYTEQAASNASAIAAEFINLKLNSISADSADIRYLKTENLEAEVANLGYVKAETIEAEYVKAGNLEAEVANIGYIKAETIEAEYVRIDKANIDTGWIDTAMIGESVITSTQIADASITDAKIVELTANKITAGTLSVERLEIRGSENSIVYEINNITGALQAENVDTINGEVMTPRTITADKIVAKSITADEIAVNAITAEKILTNSITADKLNINDLSAISALIGGWELGIGYIRDLDTDGRYTGIGRYGIAEAFFAGGTLPDGSDGIFRVGHDGRLIATDAQITGIVKATSLYFNDGNYGIWVKTPETGDEGLFFGMIQGGESSEDTTNIIYGLHVGVAGNILHGDTQVTGDVITSRVTVGDTSVTSGKIELTRSDVAVFQTHTTTGVKIAFGIGQSGYNRGIYDYTISKWMICLDENNEVIINTSGRVMIGGTTKANLAYLQISGASKSVSMSGDSGLFGPYTAKGDTKNDSAINLGWSDCRWKKVYAASSSISTSDEREKAIIGNLDQYKPLFMELKPIAFRWNRPDEEDVFGIHFGLGAQTTEVSMNELGMSPDLAFLQHDYFDPDRNGRTDRYGIAYEEVQVLTMAVVQDHELEIRELKQKIADLENQIEKLSA